MSPARVAPSPLECIAIGMRRNGAVSFDQYSQSPQLRRAGSPAPGVRGICLDGLVDSARQISDFYLITDEVLGKGTLRCAVPTSCAAREDVTALRRLWKLQENSAK